MAAALSIEPTGRPSTAIELASKQGNISVSNVFRLQHIQCLSGQSVILLSEEIDGCRLATTALHRLTFKIVQTVQ